MGEARSRRERKKQETRQRLLEVAWELFRVRGYEETTVEEITEAADVAKGTFFNYFETKEAVLGEIMAWRVDLMGRQALSGEDVPESAVGRIKVMISAMVREFSSEGDLARHLFMARIGAPIKRQSAHRLGSLIHELVMQAQAQQEIRDDLDPGLVTRLLMTCFFFSFDRWHHLRPEPPEHAAHGGPELGGPEREGPGCEAPCPPEERRPQQVGVEQAPIVLEARLMESVDALMNGLGGPAILRDRAVLSDPQGRKP